ncbi:MAG TPA: OmpA family protein [Polyangiales bacterium]|jgi:outer membrane protein OmpA-like peptidoglycan-associated protein|nr:OmpA family protein [Polyangiales bacterium]
MRPLTRRALIALAALLLAASPLSAADAQSHLRLEIKDSDIDIPGRTLHFRLTGGSVSSVDYEMFSPEGAKLHTGHEDYTRSAPGEPLLVTWPDLGKKAENFRMELKFNAGNSWVSFQIVRFFIEVPHEEVEFDSGKAEVKADQQGKLDKPLMALKEAATKYSKLMNVSLYVAGHTDTVGQASDNQRLSERRAQAIAQWFSAHGLRGLPIYVRGFGEGALAVNTPDNTPEQRNRRAQYIVSSFAPTLAGPGSWRKVQ